MLTNSNNDKARLFFAIVLDDEAREFAAKLQSELRSNTEALQTRGWQW